MSNFRKALLENCKKSFHNFFSEDIKKIRESNDDDKIIRFKTKLFGNINFVGELNRRNLLSVNIIVSVFDMLLAVESEEQISFVNDDTIEGACVLMNHVGYLLDNKIQKQEKKDHDDKLKKSNKNVMLFKKIFQRFDDLGKEGMCSLRVRMLILNLIENR